MDHEFSADQVAAFSERFTDEYTVISVLFGRGNPDAGGEHWNFSVAPNEGNEVCTVKEVQQHTIYGGISSVLLSRERFVVEFDEVGEEEIGLHRLQINLPSEIEDWSAVVSMAQQVFESVPRSKIENAA